MISLHYVFKLNFFSQCGPLDINDDITWNACILFTVYSQGTCACIWVRSSSHSHCIIISMMPIWHKKVSVIYASRLAYLKWHSILKTRGNKSYMIDFRISLLLGWPLAHCSAEFAFLFCGDANAFFTWNLEITAPF